jgi:hypothetical protein
MHQLDVGQEIPASITPSPLTPAGCGSVCTFQPVVLDISAKARLAAPYPPTAMQNDLPEQDTDSSWASGPAPSGQAPCGPARPGPALSGPAPCGAADIAAARVGAAVATESTTDPTTIASSLPMAEPGTARPCGSPDPSPRDRRPLTLVVPNHGCISCSAS